MDRRGGHAGILAKHARRVNEPFATAKSLRPSARRVAA
jgi:hypothetical protein